MERVRDDHQPVPSSTMVALMARPQFHKGAIASLRVSTWISRCKYHQIMLTAEQYSDATFETCKR